MGFASFYPSYAYCIGSDDPLTFATNLRQEYQFVHDALVLAGCSEAEASKWLDEVRETGLNYRFTVKREPDSRINSLCNLDKLTIASPP